MDFIFMLTRGDKTIEDCLDVMEQIAPLGLTHIGFKDVGVEYATLEKLAARIKAIGATSYMEVVSETPEACLRSAEIGRRLGIDRLLGGTDVAAVQKILAGTHTQYYPFSGFPKGHPTKLGGKPADVQAHCAAFTKAGCAGTDLLASIRLGDLPGVGMTVIDGIVRSQRSRNTPPATRIPEIVPH